jgi:N-acetylglucosaminyl-diphospho-decaprenol L-rhamnosyltransferase
MAQIFVVILNHNTRDLLREAIGSVLESRTSHRRTVYVVDNASTDGSAEMVEAEFPEARLIRAPRNGGFAYGNNLALREILAEDTAGGDSPRFIMLLNPDAKLEFDALELLVQYLLDHPAAGAVGPCVLLPDGSLDLACRRSFPTPEVSFYRMIGLSRLFPRSRRFGRYNLTYLDPMEEAEVDSLVGAAMLLREEVVREVGLLDEQFFMYGEDLDWCFRIKSYGWRVVYYPQAVVQHYKRAASTRRAMPSIRAFYGAMRVFHRKHYARRTVAPVNVLIEAAIYLKESWALATNMLRPPARRRVG